MQASQTTDNQLDPAAPDDTVLTALVVEDDPDAAFIATRALSDIDITVTEIGRGDDALERIETSKPDLLVLDLHLPGVSGVDILRFIRDAPTLADTLVILMTADAATADTIANDADMVLLKPIMYTQLRDLAKRMLQI